jgi:hypothetical protein
MQDRFTELYGANAFDDSRNYTTDGTFKPRKLQFADSAAQPQARVRGYAFADAPTVSHDVAPGKQRRIASRMDGATDEQTWDAASQKPCSGSNNLPRS